MIPNSKYFKIILLLLILAIAVFFRFYKLNDIPPGLYPDVAMNGTNALDANATHDYKVFYPENNGREGLLMNLIALSFLIFGPSVWAIKIVAAIFGTLTVLGTYLLTKELFVYVIASPASTGRNNPAANGQSLSSDGIATSPRYAGLLTMTAGEIIALLSAFFLAVSFWHVNLSRIGFRAIMVPFFLVWGLYFLFKGINKIGNWKLEIGNFLLAGLMFGLGFHTYIAFRIAPLVLLPIFIIEIIRHWPRPKLGRWVILIIFALIAAAPLLYYYAKNPADFMGRAGQVSIFASANPVKALFESTIKTLGQFIVAGDYNWRHNLSGSSEIFWPLIPFFLIGIFYSIIQIFKKHSYFRDNLSCLACHWTLLVAWGAMLLPAIATNEGLPHALRSIGAIPSSYIFAGLGFYIFATYLNSKLKKYEDRLFAYKYVAVGLVIFFLIFVGAMEYIRYFITWGQNPEVKGAFGQRFVDEANYLISLPTNVNKFVIVNEDGVPVPYPDGIPMPAQTIMFLTRINQPAAQITYLRQEQISQIPNFPISQFPTIILPMKYDQAIFEKLRLLFPNGLTEIKEKEGFAALRIGF